MQKVLITVIAVFAVQILCPASEVKHEQYDEVDGKVIKIQPEKYKNKKIYYSGKFLNLQPTFPQYMERGGIKADKYFWLVVEPENIPVIAKKRDMEELVMAIKERSIIRVYGKMKKFKGTPEEDDDPVYYLELADVEIIKEPKKKRGGAAKKGNKKPHGKKKKK